MQTFGGGSSEASRIMGKIVCIFLDSPLQSRRRWGEDDNLFIEAKKMTIRSVRASTSPDIFQ